MSIVQLKLLLKMMIEESYLITFVNLIN